MHACGNTGGSWRFIGGTEMRKLKKQIKEGGVGGSINGSQTPETSWRCTECAADPMPIMGADGRKLKFYSGNMHAECFKYHPRHMYGKLMVDPNRGKL